MSDNIIRSLRGGAFKVRMELFQGAEDASPRIDLSGRTLSIVECNLPFQLETEIIDLDQGEFFVENSTATDTVRRNYEYTFRIKAEGPSLEPYITPPIPVVFT